MDLFQAAADKDLGNKPLAERMRPRTLDEIVGQDQILGEGRALRRLIGRGEIPSMLLWGPPGSGKTTLARILADVLAAEFESVSAVMSGVRELRQIVGRAKEKRDYHRKRTVLFIDEIHRFNKAQQDALLPHVESGLVTLVGATTENPSFEVNAALLSRCKVFVLAALDEAALVQVVRAALDDGERGVAARGITVTEDAAQAIATSSHGDARRALNTLEVALDLAEAGDVLEIDVPIIEEAVQHKALLYDKAGDEHYGVVSALIKSLRGSDPDAAVYWMVRMLEAGEEPRYILRRLVIFASEDIGNADPQALAVATDALRAFELVGLPEGVLPMTQAAAYLACAPKSNAVIKAYGAARKDIRSRGPLPVPNKLRNAPTRLMKSLDYGKDYKYPHNFSGNYVAESYLPEELTGRRYYEPSDQGAEALIGERLAGWRAARDGSADPEGGADPDGDDKG